MLQETVSAVLHEVEYSLKDVTDREVEELLDIIMHSKKIFVTGVGRSGFACRGFAMRLMHMGLEAYFIGDTVTPSFSEKDLLIVGSGSGATASLVTYAEKAKKLGGKIALLTIDTDSVIGRLADIKIPLNAPSPKVEKNKELTSIQPMGSMFEQSLMVMFDVIIMKLMKKMGQDESGMFMRHANLE